MVGLDEVYNKALRFDFITPRPKLTPHKTLFLKNNIRC